MAKIAKRRATDRHIGREKQDKLRTVLPSRNWPQGAYWASRAGGAFLLYDCGAVTERIAMSGAQSGAGYLRESNVWSADGNLRIPRICGRNFKHHTQ